MFDLKNDAALFLYTGRLPTITAQSWKIHAGADRMSHNKIGYQNRYAWTFLQVLQCRIAKYIRGIQGKFRGLLVARGALCENL